MSIEENSDDDFLRLFEIHTLASARLARAAWPHMKDARYGRVINTTSDSIWGLPAAYVTVKAANFGPTRALAVEGAPHGNHVNGVAPTGVTQMSPPPAAGQDDRDQLFPASAVAPTVIALLMRASNANGLCLQVGGNRAAEIFLAVTDGYAASGSDPSTEIADDIEHVVDRAIWSSPKNFEDAFALTIERARRRWLS